MKIISAQPKLVEQVHRALIAEIAGGGLPPGSRIIQEQLAQELGVSRQPVQQALLLLRNQGVLSDAPGRGLIVAPLDLAYVRNIYDIRSVIEGLAFRRAAERSAEQARKLGPSLMQSGREAVASGTIAEMIAADLRFHAFIHELARNPLIAPMMEAQWTCTQRVMGEALLRNGSSRHIWIQHEAMLQAVMDGDGDLADALARQHIIEAAAVVIDRLPQGRPSASGESVPLRDRL
jgi:DNA-binding GntR family transcriptional regulator